jgi:hypothetical protein
MPVTNSDTAAKNNALNTFFEVFRHGSPTYGPAHVPDLMQSVFSRNPSVGITDHGPNFKGATDVETLFDTIFIAFPEIWWTETLTQPGLAHPILAPRLYSLDTFATPTIGVQSTFVGTHKGDWFQHTGAKDHYSLPLSAIPHTSKPTLIPLCAVFTFGDAQNPDLVTQLSLYLDRYKLLRDLQPGDPADFDSGIIQLIEDLTTQLLRRFQVIKELKTMIKEEHR